MHAIGRQHRHGLHLVQDGIRGAMAGGVAADRVDAAVRTTFSGTLHQFVIDIGLREVDGLGAARFRHGKAFGNFINCDDPAGS